MGERSRNSWSLTKNAPWKLWNSRHLFSRPKVFLSALIVGLGLMVASRLTAQTFTTLYSFTNGSDGANPEAGLILSGNTLYGTAYAGGSSGDGTIFKVNTDGTGFTTLYNFTGNSDGTDPAAGLISLGNTLYGTTADFNSLSNGTVFKVNTDGTGFTNLYNFTASSAPFYEQGTNTDGANPAAGLILSGNTLYGTASYGGRSGYGTVFVLNTDGTDFTNLHSFTAPSGEGGAIGTNSDGALPAAGLILSGNALYGATLYGGSSGNGTVFAVNTNGMCFTNLHSFTGVSDGDGPDATLVLSGNTLYGTAHSGGSSGNGTVFAVNTDGTGFTNLYNFTATLAGPFSILTNSDGVYPGGGLILSGNTLYGTTYKGGSSGNGTVFAVNTDGTGFTNLYNFTSTLTNLNNSDGARPEAGLILSGNTLYGTATQGGNAGQGTVFSLSFAPQLTITLSGTNVILTWPTYVAGFSYTGFTLLSTTNLMPAAWSIVSPAPVVLNGQNTVTNPISDTQQFYRLSQ
jgi:uncharacterized repeat protein (TIGR03803 family)